MGGQPGVRIAEIKANVEIRERVGRTTLEIRLQNDTDRMQEAELLVPVPIGAAVHSLTIGGEGNGAAATVLPRETARNIYTEIVSKTRDPALLEFVKNNLVRSSVFPVPAGNAQWVRFTYDELLPVFGDRIDYVLPRTESLAYQVPWDLNVNVAMDRPIATLFSPSHNLATLQPDTGAASIHVAPMTMQNAGSFRLSCLVRGDKDLNATFLAYPDADKDGGYFLMLAGLPDENLAGKTTKPMTREVTLILDHSGSMRGEKIEQVRESALQVLAGLEEGEFFNLLIYNDQVDTFAQAPVAKNKESIKAVTEFLDAIQARGGTNIHDALRTGLRQAPTKDTLPIILFLTDGLPTTGITTESAICQMAREENKHNRRIFALGVGADVNSPLLSAVAAESRAVPTFILPTEDVELKVAQVFEKLDGPVMSEARLLVEPGRATETLPAQLPDYFKGDQLVAIGHYTGNEPIDVALSGDFFGQPADFHFTFNPADATLQNSFVPRLWASRKIGVLLEAIRNLGADGAQQAAAGGRMQELVEEVVCLSTEFGILTEYTAFLAQDGSETTRDTILRAARQNIQHRNTARAGFGGINQELNINALKSQSVTNTSNISQLFSSINDAMVSGSLSFQNPNAQFHHGGNGQGISPNGPRNLGQGGFGGGGFRGGGGGFGGGGGGFGAVPEAAQAQVPQVGVQQVNDLTFYWREGRWLDSRLLNKDEAPKATRTVNFGTGEFFDILDQLAENNRQGCIALNGDILLRLNGENLLLTTKSKAE